MGKGINAFWADFCSSTGIRGFSYLHKAICTTESIFWSLMIVLCSFLTVYDVFNTTEKFLSVPTSTKVVMIKNTSMSLGNPTLFIPLFLKDLKYGSNRFKNADQVEILLSKFDEEPDLLALMSENLAQMKSGLWYPLTEEQKEFLALISLTTELICHSVSKEQTVTGDLEEFEEIEEIKKDQQEPFVFPYSSVVYRWYNSRNVELSHIIPLVGALICQSLKLKLSSLKANETNGKLSKTVIQPCDPQIVTWLGTAPMSESSKFILGLKLSNSDDRELLTFYTITQYIILRFYYQELFAVAWTSERDMDDDWVLLIDMAGGAAITRKSQNLYNQPFFFHHTVKVQLLGHHQDLNLKRHPCLNDETQFECVLKCRSDFMMSQCACAPLSTFFLYSKSNLTSCDHIFFLQNQSNEVCNKIHKYFHPDKKCVDMMCHTNCVTKVYSFTITDDTIAEYNGTELRLSVDPFLYPRFEEVLLLDTRSFLSQLGGNLSFWFGASYMVLLHVIVFMIRLPFYFWKSSALKDKETEPDQLRMTEALKRANAENLLRFRRTQSHP